MFENVSFVLIARNESFGIQKSLGVLSNTRFQNAEFILVDSGSVDDTGRHMEEFATKVPGCKHVKLTGTLNASIARNAGLVHASRKFCFFVDGDTEISSDFINDALKVFDTHDDCVAVAGDLTDYFYNDDFSKLLNIVPNRFSIDTVHTDKGFGGNVIVKTEIAKQLQWDSKFRIHEDFDFSLRLREFGQVFLIPSNMGIHHTRYDTKNAYHLLFTRSPTHFGRLIRRHCAKNMRYLLKINRGHWIGIFYYCAALGIAVFDGYLAQILLFATLAFLVLDFYKAALKKFPSSFFDWVVVRALYPMFVLYGFVLD